MQEFKVNKFLSLKLENNITIIYVVGEKFSQCKKLILEIPVSKIIDFDEIQSIDELIDKQENEETKFKIPPETEFWGHCSNIQVWAENNYNTKLLHSNLAFSLLKQLVDAGDPIANRVFKEEIVKRLSFGYPPVVEYLIVEGFIDFLDKEELLFGILPSEEAEVIQDLERVTNSNFSLVDQLEGHESIESAFVVRNGNIYELDIAWSESKPRELPDSLKRLKFIDTLYYSGVFVKEIPKIIAKLKTLSELKIFCEGLNKIPNEIKSLNSLNYLLIVGGVFKSIPEPLLSLNSLKRLSIIGTSLEIIPESIRNLKSIQILDLRSNNIKKLPESIAELSNLKRLNISNNPIQEIPRSLLIIDTLKEIVISKTTINNTKLSIINNLKKRIKITERD